MAIPLCADAQWVAIQELDEWNEPKDEYVAFSEKTTPEIGDGYTIRIGVSDCGSAHILVDGGAPDFNYEDQAKLEDLLFFRVPVEIDGHRHEWAAGTMEHKNSFFFMSDTIQELKDAIVLRLILVTHQYGSRVYKFNMRGSSRAIQKVCPDLF